MPDTLAHYMLSYLVASRVVRLRNAVFLVLIRLLPCIDALLRIHRWIIHSLVLAIIGISIATIPDLSTSLAVSREGFIGKPIFCTILQPPINKILV